MLEESLREMFAGQAERLPVADDPATAAIRSGRNRSRRRTMVGGVAAAFVLIVVVGGTFGARGVWVPNQAQRVPPDSALGGPGQVIKFEPELTAAELASQPVELSLDLRLGSRISAASGNWYAMDGVGDIQTVVRVPLGWIYAGESRVRLLRTDGIAVDLFDRPIAWLVSPRGDTIAGVNGRNLKIWSLSAEGLGVASAGVTVPAGTVPVAFLGDRVALRNADATRFDYWRPRDTHKPTFTTALNRIYDSATGETFGLLGECLVRVSVDGGLRLGTALGCGPSLAEAPARAVASPDGRLLAVPTSDGLNILDMAHAEARSPLNAAAEPVVAATCEADLATTPVWSAKDTVITTAAGGLIACSIDGPRRPVRLRDNVTDGWEMIPIRA